MSGCKTYGVTHVALESTGVYWKPVTMLEDAFTLLLINMQDLKRVPGRKTDVRDSEWLVSNAGYRNEKGLKRKHSKPSFLSLSPALAFSLA